MANCTYDFAVPDTEDEALLVLTIWTGTLLAPVPASYRMSAISPSFGYVEPTRGISHLAPLVR